MAASGRLWFNLADVLIMIGVGSLLFETFMEPKIIFEDEWLLVVDNPAKMVVNKCETQKGGGTLEEIVGRK